MEIKIENLTKAYGDFKAVDNMNLNIADGELVGLLGPSGCGKSTFMRFLVSLDTPSEGEILYRGKDITKLRGEELRQNRQNIQMVFQDRPCIPELCTVSAYDCCGQHHVPVN